MADLSTGNDDKSVTKINSFNKFLGRSPARSVSSKKSINPFSKIFSRSNKKIDKQNIPDDVKSDPSITTEPETGMIEETVPTKTTAILQKVEEAAPKVIEVVRHANIENLFQGMTKANPVAEAKESTPVTDEKKPAEFFNKFVEVAKKTKEEVQEKAMEKLQKIANEGGLTEAYKAITTSSKDNKAPKDEKQPLDDKKPQENSVNIIDKATVPVPLSSLITQGLQDEVAVAVAGEVVRVKTEETNQGGKQEEEEEKQEDNCVASLAEGLQKICGQWNNKKED